MPEASRIAAPVKDLGYLQIEGRSFDLLLERLRGSMSTAAVRRDLLMRAGGFPDGMITAQDWVMYVNVARLTEWHLVPDRLAFFRDHPGTVTRAGSPLKGLTALRAIRSFWQPSELPTPPHRPITAYSRYYRHVLGWALRACVRERDFRSYREALIIARDILPRRKRSPARRGAAVAATRRARPARPGQAASARVRPKLASGYVIRWSGTLRERIRAVQCAASPTSVIAEPRRRALRSPMTRPAEFAAVERFSRLRCTRRRAAYSCCSSRCASTMFFLIAVVR